MMMATLQLLPSQLSAFVPWLEKIPLLKPAIFLIQRTRRIWIGNVLPSDPVYQSIQNLSPTRLWQTVWGKMGSCPPFLLENVGSIYTSHVCIQEWVW
jgi:hypothetical protein